MVELSGQIAVELFTIQNLLLAISGVLIGIIMGCIPGLTVVLGVILFLPLTYGLNPTTAIISLLALYVGGCYGGSISAILINTPGTNSALATTLDGYPLAKKGKAKKALTMSLYASVIGGLISALILLFAAPPVAKVALSLRSPAYFSLAIFGLSIIAGVSGDNIIKGLISGALGIFVSTMGLDAFTGTVRFSFGSTFLYGGIALLPALIGFIALAQIIIKSVEETSKANENINKSNNLSIKGKDDKLSMKEMKKSIPTIIKSSIISSFIGAMPGAGGGVAQFVSYNEAKRCSKNPQEFGKGAVEGIAAAESSNNAVVGSAMIPLLTLGIPGDGVTAVLLGAFILHGLVPGPSLFTKQAVTTYSIIIGLIICNILLLILGKYLTRQIANVIKIPYKLLGPMIMVFCFAGAFANSGNIGEMIVIVPLAIFSYILSKLDFSVIPLMLGLILGPIAEANFTRSMVLSDGNLSIFVTDIPSLAILLITVFFIIMFIKMNKKTSSILTEEGAYEKLKGDND
ncbi:MAG: tripartite tricarboxylate transporter permease [Clostridia bacterium]|nr:tripartite tricarboxylate transporter permease [Clostridia bacterium]